MPRGTKGQQDPVAALCRQRRSDAGRARVFSVPVVAQIHALYRQHPGWPVQLHHNNLRACATLEPQIGAIPLAEAILPRQRADQETQIEVNADGVDTQPLPASPSNTVCGRWTMKYRGHAQQGLSSRCSLHDRRPC